MKDVNLHLDVICTRPNWVFQGNIYKNFVIFQQPTYRLYVNSDLVTERTWIYDNSIKSINENVWLRLPEGPTHSIRLEPVVRMASQAKFLLFNPQSKSVALKNKQRVSDLEFTFTV